MGRNPTWTEGFSSERLRRIIVAGTVELWQRSATETGRIHGVLRVGLIGYGALSQVVARELEHQSAIAVQAVLVRSGRSSSVPPGFNPVESLGTFLEHELDVVVECAGQDAVRECAEAVLSARANLMLASTGALSDPAFLARLVAVATSGGTRILIPAGAIAGLDGLVALRRAGLTSARYISSKPPLAWIGTPAEQAFELDALPRRTVIFTGTAREAARLYPKNANLAVTIALAGAGLEHTEVILVADPALTDNVGRVEAHSLLGSVTAESRGSAAPGNPKSSAITAYSILASLEGSLSPIGLPF